MSPSICLIFGCIFTDEFRDRLNYDDDEDLKNDNKFLKYKLIQEAGHHKDLSKAHSCEPARSSFFAKWLRELE